MITLITGTPGAGKTLYAVSELLGTEYAGRPLYVDGIPELLLDHEVAQEPLDWHDWLPEGKDAVLVVDECQRVWRPRHYGKDVPPSVAAMETHRHKGVDIVLITQHPNLLDSNVRRLVGRHIHVRRLWGMNRTMVYEWDGATDPQRTSTAVSRSWKYPKKAFSWYKSATAHTARKQRMPASIFLFAIAAIGVPAIGYAGYKAMFSRFEEVNELPTDTVQNIGPGDGVATPTPPQARYLDVEPEQPAWDIDNFTPRDIRHPESAPAYDHLTEIKTFPVISGCIIRQDECNCYTQQGTPVFLPPDLCRDRIDHWVFNPYKEPENDFESKLSITTPDPAENAQNAFSADPQAPIEI